MKKTEEIKGYLFGMLTALCWAISPVFIQRGIEGLPSYIWGTAVGSFFASLVYLFWFLLRNRIRGINPAYPRRAVYWQIAGGLASGLGILFRNIALESTQVAVVIALAQISALLTLLLGPVLLGRAFKERITPRLIFGIVSIVSGSVLILYGQSL
ncbi:MAG: DMT family transporter [Anaerolineales bacterium]|nr:DMT family transporter [Anaerolineales bacterium]